jgi:ABC-type transporter Mla MlaB component
MASEGTATVLRISIIDESDESTRLAVEGWLTGPWVEELRLQSERFLSHGNGFTLDLEKLWFVDSKGAALLRELAARRVEHVNCSAFISEQLKETTL